MDEKGLGKRLQQARQAAGLTQQQLCQRANLSFSTLTKIERGAIRAPSIFTVEAIAMALNTGLDELTGFVAGQSGRHLSKTKSGVSFVYFDVNGCLVRFYQPAFTKLAKESGAPSDMVETAFWHHNDDVCRGAMTLADFNDYLAERIGVTTVDWQKQYMDTSEPIQPMQDMIIWAQEHFKVGMLTNIMPGFLNAMVQRSLLPKLHYDAIVDSSEVGCIKPEPKIYEIAQQRSGCPPEEILLIDDSRANLMAAEKAGWHVMWFDDSRLDESVERVREALVPAD
jgi:FMN phosphatase YigB (HAD superfamily)